MQLQRLTEIVFALMSGSRITAKILAERFQVSTRTIYRDIDALSIAGIPVYTDKGNGGGIFIQRQYALSNAILTSEEKEELIASLKSNVAPQSKEVSTRLIEKLSGLFKREIDYIEVDLSDWHDSDDVQINFEILKNAILNKTVTQISYTNASGEASQREIEPLKLVFKSKEWYVYAYCCSKLENRLFKLRRIKQIVPTNRKFVRICEEKNVGKSIGWKGDNVNVTIKADPSLAAILSESVPAEKMSRAADGDFIIDYVMPCDDWVVSYFLSFGDKAVILKPQWLQDKIMAIYKNALKINGY